ncbi:uncharacterized protein LOC118647217 [Monomorium pharaonis]|uniref:uncharacterized protein LOC118647217 n=1 Tax=Monomorium pharaonis TaxID=307658 RepID=UPI00174783AE|nr:uncharacterized protein LOC118647217 [Monomorium pharaonis]
MSKNKVNRNRKGTKQSSGHEKRSKSSSKRPLNRFELETPDDTNVSTSAKKLKESAEEYNIEVDASEKRQGTTEYAEWLENHANECDANHEGSAGKMEVDAVIEMFQRSEELYQVKYANYIGDGDSKTFKGILDSEYENFTVSKKECVDHVQKRIGTRLHNLKKVTKGLGGKGKLTGKLIDELWIYYGLAIRRNCDSVEKMRNDIWATLYHKMSTDEEPQHEDVRPVKIRDARGSE